MSTSTVFILFAIAALLTGSVLVGGRLPRPFRARSCQGRAWRRAFPSASKNDIRQFLSLFVDAFSFHERERLKLAPQDEILRIYTSKYPSRFCVDDMELETLAEQLERHHSLKLETLWSSDLTLGELFSHAHPAAVNGSRQD